jgi:hypothetical protein
MSSLSHLLSTSLGWNKHLFTNFIAYVFCIRYYVQYFVYRINQTVKPLSPLSYGEQSGQSGRYRRQKGLIKFYIVISFVTKAESSDPLLFLKPSQAPLPWGLSICCSSLEWSSSVICTIYPMLPLSLFTIVSISERTLLAILLNTIMVTP